MGLLRFLLAISVVIAHSGPMFGTSLIGGEVAVQTFYVISGFYMGMVLTEKYVGTNSSYKLFLSNRLLRLYPIYWVMLIISVTISLVAYFKLGPEASFKISSYVNLIADGKMSWITFTGVCFSNIFLIFQDWFMFLKLNPNTGGLLFSADFLTSKYPLYQFLFLPQAWTIGVEIRFYLVAQFLVKQRNYVLILLVCLSIITRVSLYNMGYKNDPWTYRFFPNELAFFLLGILVYRLGIFLKTNPFKGFSLLEKCALPLALLFTIVYPMIHLEFIRYIYPVLIALLIPLIFNKFKKVKYDVWIGELSYPIYISHITLYIILKKLPIPEIAKGSIALAIFTILFSVLLNELVSKRVEKYRQKRIRNQKTNSIVSVS